MNEIASIAETLGQMYHTESRHLTRQTRHDNRYENHKPNENRIFDIHESVHRDITMKITNEVQLCRLIHYS
jgi:IS30 family transposase